MTPGVFLAIRLPTAEKALALWSDVRAGVPHGWKWTSGDAVLCAAVGVGPEHLVTVVGPPVDGHEVELTVLLNGNQLQITNVIPKSGGPLGGEGRARAVGAFVVECVKPVLARHSDARIEVPRAARG